MVVKTIHGITKSRAFQLLKNGPMQVYNPSGTVT